MNNEALKEWLKLPDTDKLKLFLEVEREMALPATWE
jgi:hypothetical protein